MGAAPLEKEEEKEEFKGVFFEPGTPRQPVNYAPWEVTEQHTVLTKDERHELRHMHEVFQISVFPPPPEGASTLIGDYVKFVPYNSEKRSFRKLGRAGFDCESFKHAHVRRQLT